MKQIRKGMILAALAALALTACGGGGGGGALERPEAFRVTITAQDTTLRPNTTGEVASPGSEFATTINVTVRNRDNTTVDDGTVVTLVVPNGELGNLSTTTDLATQSDSLQLTTSGGAVSAVFHTTEEGGDVEVRASAFDPAANQTVTASITIDVEKPAAGLPAGIDADIEGGVQYVQGSGGTTSRVVRVEVTDPNGGPVAEPAGNNVQVSVDSEVSGAPTVSGTNASGQTVSGETINIATVEGEARFNIVSGTNPGVYSLRITSDAADNDVDNGIQSPVVQIIEVVVGDGVPFSVTITTFPLNSLRVNPVSDDVVVDDGGIPNDPNATYSLRVNAIVTDRQGNPPARPVRLQLGLIDSPTFNYPLQGPGDFYLSGFDGDPEEGGVNFFAPTGEFLTAGGGAGPGDTLALFGDDVVGNLEHEAARTIATVIDDDNLTVIEPFNDNDLTGNIVDSGPVIPYIIGRARYGNVEFDVVTNEDGVASTFLNYPVTAIGRSLVFYAQGSNGAGSESGDVRTFADVVLGIYPALAPLTLTAAPSSIQANTTSSVTVCAVDGASNGVPGIFVNFVSQVETGTVDIDGEGASGTLDTATNENGCTVATVTTSGIVQGSAAGSISFFAGDASADVEIAPPGNQLLQAQPSTLIGDQTNGTVALTLLDANGNPLPGVALSGSCETADAIITQQPGTTNSSGQATARITIDGLDAECPDEDPGETSCSFVTATGAPSAEVKIRGREFTGDPANPPAQCEGDPPAQVVMSTAFQQHVTGADNGLGADATATITVDGTSISCTYQLGTTNEGATTGTCTDVVNSGDTLTVNLNLPAGATTCNDADTAPGGPEGCFDGWDGDCAIFGETTSGVLIVGDTAPSCTAIFQ